VNCLLNDSSTADGRGGPDRDHIGVSNEYAVLVTEKGVPQFTSRNKGDGGGCCSYMSTFRQHKETPLWPQRAKGEARIGLHFQRAGALVGQVADRDLDQL
jgi:hypothetical protein